MDVQVSRSPSLIKGYYSTALRHRDIWKVVGPILTNPTVGLQESELQDCDFIIQLQSYSLSLRAILLTPSSVQPCHKEHTISRLKSFYHTMDSSSSQRGIITFLLSEESFDTASGKCNLDGLLTLQALVAESLPAPSSIIPIPDSSYLLPCIEEYTTRLADIPVKSPSFTDSLALLSHVTSESPDILSEQETNILSDLFPSLRSLSQAMRTLEGWGILVDYLGEARAKEIAGFWGHDTVGE
ncbi:hypothetical protein ETB97_008231 [Aspergillus alliaceus]|uniref:Uncharacterized protein n=1 Tax=Petromyces alliaceus TaxID=209559 RepID=A0A8H6AAP8_PETAA|nr:hypothetical protein ETB97_008231 [Aspergillus burnettii]